MLQVGVVIDVLPRPCEHQAVQYAFSARRVESDADVVPGEACAETDQHGVQPAIAREQCLLGGDVMRIGRFVLHFHVVEVRAVLAEYLGHRIRQPRSAPRATASRLSRRPDGRQRGT